MNFRHLRYFVEIVDHGSMIKAAEALFVAQPALSQHMRNLEQELGVRLLSRTARGVIPTEAGHELLQRARAILAQVDEAREAIKAGGVSPQGSVVLGLPPSVSAMLCVPLITRMQTEAPRVALRVVEGTSGYVLDWLQSGRVDLGVLYSIQRAAGVLASELFQEELYLIRPPTTDGPPEIAFTELERIPLVLPARHHGLRDMIDRLAREHRIRLDIRVEIDALTQMKALVRHGVGCTVLSYPAISEELRRGELAAIRIVEPTIRRTMYVATASNRPASNAVAITVRLIGQCVNELLDERITGLSQRINKES